MGRKKSKERIGAGGFWGGIILAFCGLLILNNGFCQTNNLRARSTGDGGAIEDELTKLLKGGSGEAGKDFVRILAENFIVGGSKGNLVGRSMTFANMREAGLDGSLLGHSAWRQAYIEELVKNGVSLEQAKQRVDEVINQRILFSLENGGEEITLCVGSEEETWDAQKEEIIGQLERDLAGVSGEQLQGKKINIAHEPVALIGAIASAAGQDVGAEDEMIQFIHQGIYDWMAYTYGEEISQSVNILYGASVSGDNVDRIMAVTGVDSQGDDIPLVHGVLFATAGAKVDGYLDVARGVQRAAERDDRQYVAIVNLKSMPGEKKTPPGEFLFGIYEMILDRKLDPEKVVLGIADQDANLGQWIAAREQEVENIAFYTQPDPLPEEAVFVEGGDTRESVRMKELTDLLLQINREISEPGAGELPTTIVISDIHAAAGPFAMFLGDALSIISNREVKISPDESISTQLETQGVSLSELNGEIIIDGDIFDRGKEGLKSFRLIEELVDLGEGKVTFIMGNHDIWTYANLSGMCYPFYEGYNFYGDTKAEELVAQKRLEMPDEINDVSWWVARVAEYNRMQKDFEEEFLPEKKELRKSFIDDYHKYSSDWTDGQKDAWEKFAGYFYRIKVNNPYIGLNGIGKTSTVWWKQTVEELNEAYRARSEVPDVDPDEISAWETAISFAKDISAEVERRANQAMEEEKWWYRVIESINTQAYSSVEWWGKDWSSHPGWGENIINEVNAEIESGMINEPVLTQENYINSPTLQSIADFYEKNFNLYVKDQYGNLVTHGWLPVEDNGDIVINYGGDRYTGNSVFSALDLISQDVKAPEKTLVDKQEPLSLVNSWYSDLTTRNKPNHVQDYVNKIGVATIQKKLGVKDWITGHNPLAKLGLPFMIPDGEYNHLEVDKGMSPKFGGEGGYATLGPDGITLRGLSSPDSKDIETDPLTRIVDKKENSVKEIVNEGMSGSRYLQRIGSTIAKELILLSDRAVREELPHLNYGNMFAAEKGVLIIDSGVILSNIGSIAVLESISQANINLDIVVWTPEQSNQNILHELGVDEIAEIVNTADSEQLIDDMYGRADTDGRVLLVTLPDKAYSEGLKDVNVLVVEDPEAGERGAINAMPLVMAKGISMLYPSNTSISEELSRLIASYLDKDMLDEENALTVASEVREIPLIIVGEEMASAQLAYEEAITSL